MNISSTKKRLMMAGIGCLLISAATLGHAADRIWTGAGNQNWSDPADWGGTAPVAGDSLFFDGSVGLAPINDLSAATVISNIVFNASAAAFTIKGNAITLPGNITNNSASTQTNGFQITQNGTINVFNAAAGDMVFSNVQASGTTIVKEGPFAIKLAGSTSDGNVRARINAGTVICAKVSGNALGAADSAATSTSVNSGGTLRIIGPGTDQLHFNQRLIMNGGTFQQQNVGGLTTITLEEIASLSGTNLASVVENGQANSTNRLDIGGGTGHRGIYNGTIRDGAGGKLALQVYRANNIQQLGGTNTYSGTTSVNNNNVADGVAMLIVNGAHLGGGFYTVSGLNSATFSPRLGVLGGGGTFSVAGVTIGNNGILSPGGALSADLADSATLSDTTAVMTFSNNVALNTAFASLTVQLNGPTPGTGYDQVRVLNDGVFTNNLANLNVSLGYSPAPGDKFTIVSVGGTNPTNNVGTFGSFNGITTTLNQNSIFVDTTSGQSFQISYRAEGSTFDMGTNLDGSNAGNDIMLMAVSPVVSTNLVWRGDGSANIWDLSATANWVSTNGTPTAYQDFSALTFDDTATNRTVSLQGILSPATLFVNTTNTYLFSDSGALDGTIVITKTNSGSLVVVNENPITGATIIQAGRVQIGTNSTTGSLGGSINIGNNGTYAINRSDDLTLASPSFSGKGTFIHNGDGTLTISTAMPFTGVTTNSGGILQLGDGSSAKGSIGGTVYLPAGKTNNYLFAGLGNINNPVSINNAWAGSGTVNMLDNNGSVLVTASSSISSNFNGAIYVQGNTSLHAADNNSGFALGNGSTVNVPANTQAWLDRSATAYNNTFNIAGNGWIGTTPAAGAIRIFGATVNGAINLQADSRIGGTISGGTLQGVISGAYQLEIWGTTNSFVLTMGPTNGSPQGYASTLITAGSISAANSNALSSGPLTLDVGGDLRVNGNNVTVASLTSINSGLIALAEGARVRNTHATLPGTLTVGSDGTSTTFDGTFSDGAAAPLGLTKVGAGTLTLTAVNTNTGPVTVNDGSVALSGSGAFTRASSINIASGATFDVSGIGGTLNLNSGQALRGNGTLSGALIAAAGSTVNPGLSMGTLTVSGTAAVNGIYRANLNRTNTPSNCSQFASAGTTFSGATLSATNVGPRLQAGDFFQLFPGATAGFTGANLQTTDVANNALYTWNNTVSSDGRITVASVSFIVNPNPTNLVNVVSNGVLTLSWPADHTGWTLQAQTNSLGKGLSTNWADVAGSTATNKVNIPVVSTNGSVFYRMKF